MAPSIRSLLAYASTLLSQTALVQANTSQAPLDELLPVYPAFSGSVQCPIDGPTSCHNNTPIAGDSCCFVYPGGRMLLTQFWDAEVHAGGSDMDWTIHGLWYFPPSFPLIPSLYCTSLADTILLNQPGPTSATAHTTPTVQ